MLLTLTTIWASARLRGPVTKGADAGFMEALALPGATVVIPINGTHRTVGLDAL